MLNYDFLILSPDEFERFSRDILQKELRLRLESFTTGRDGGIDFRYSRASKTIIVQCKRYENFGALLANLKKEVGKVLELKPSRYILTTSVKLTDLRKSKIMALFQGYIKEPSDIQGRDDLNNYLADHRDIEKQYYKLWLASTTVMQRILNSKVVNQTELEKDFIMKNLKLYVQNDSFNQGMEILKQHRFVVISGIPGIGKTTLARFLVYSLLGQGIQEFVFVSDSINDAFSAIDPGKSQVFLFDDFLGKRNFTRSSLATNEDRKILDFIEYIKSSKNKYLVFTTREYILRQAKTELENIDKIDMDATYIVDLQKYSKISRGKILYNHLFHYGLPVAHIRSLLKQRLFLRLVDHRNYSPRLIESVTKIKVWSKMVPEEYGTTVLAYFDNPEELWEHTYSNQIAELSRCVLAIITTTDTPIFLSDLELAVQSFSRVNAEKYQRYSYFEFIGSLRELEDTFIRTQNDSHGNTVVEFHNPSIHDFLCHYLNKHRTILSDVIRSAIFFNQLVSSFTGKASDHTRIFLEKSIESLIVSRIVHDYDFLNLSLVVQFVANHKDRYYQKLGNSDILKIGYIIERLSVSEYSSLKAFLAKKILAIDFRDLEGEEIDKYLKALEVIKDDLPETFDLGATVGGLLENLTTVEELDFLSRARWIDYDFFDNFVALKETQDRIEEICEQAVLDADPREFEDLKYEVESLATVYSVELTNLIGRLDVKINLMNEKTEEYEADADYPRIEEKKAPDEDTFLEKMFESLL